MTFYRIPQVVLVVDGACVDVTGDVRQPLPPQPAITVTRGGMDEQRRPTPAKCVFTLNNRDRDYSPHNPHSSNYKKLGINTPVFVRLLLARDEFAGTSSSSWGSAEACGIRDADYAWTNVGTASDFNESGGSATHLLSAANTNRYSYLADVAYRDVGIFAECTCTVTDVTGGAIELCNLLLRGSGSTYYMVRVSVSTAEVLTVAIMTEAAVVVEAAVTVAGVVDAVSSKTVSVRAEIEGEIIRARVWKTGDPEPATWNITTQDRTYLTAGWVGIRSGLAASNSNTPVTVSYGRVEVYSMVMAGEVAKWPPTRTRDGTDKTVRIEAWDLFQRLKQGRNPLKSALRRGITSADLSTYVAYWPCEDGKDATQVAADLPGVTPMMPQGPSLPDFASADDFPCSEDLLTVNGCNLNGYVPTYTPTSGQSQVRMLVAAPAAGDTNGTTLLRVRMVGGTAEIWDVVYGTGGTLTLNIYDPTETLISTTGAVAFSLDGRPLRLSIEFTQDGADIDWNLSTIGIDGTAGGISGTTAGRTYGRVNFVGVGGNATFTGMVVGHITVQNVVDSIATLLPNLKAFVGDTATARVARLATENGITAYVGEGTTPAQLMGAQRPKTLLDLLDECPVADLGGMGSPRGEVAILYTRLNYFYNQTVAATLSLSGFQLDNFDPDFDNFPTKNKITVKREFGSEATAILTTGRLAAVDPIDGGIGVYDDAPTVSLYTDALLPDAAGYRLLQGTIDQPRFPDLGVNLANYAVRASETLTRNLIDLNLWQRLQVTGAAAADLYDTVDLLVAGYTLQLSTFVHRITVNATPYDPYRIFELDSATYGRLDSDATTVNEDLDTTETGVEVAISDAGLWSTSSGDWPFDIMIGGERMTVTAVSGASSPQTFTVTRSVNGVVKTHTTGDEVHVADPVYLAGW